MPVVQYNIIEEQAFTKDNVLIYKLFIYDLPEDVTIYELEEYFQTFGRVLKVRLLGRPKNKKCFVHFIDSKMAAKVLQETRHVFKDCIIRIEPCHSLHQPGGQTLITVLDGNFNRQAEYDMANFNIIEENALVLTLNDDCLGIICKMLGAGIDQISFALTCRRFYDVTATVSKVRHKYLNTNVFKEWSLLQTRMFLQIMGPHIKIMETLILENTVLKLLVSFCTNVETLIVKNARRSVNHLTKKMYLLRELHLLECKFEINLNFIKHLKNLKNFKVLTILENFFITGRHMHTLCSLEALSLNRCSNLTEWHFRNICKYIKNLHYLDVRGCKSLKTEDYLHISEHLLQLKTLKISCSEGDCNCLAKLPNLKSLEILITNRNCNMERLVQNLAKFRANQLEELKLIDSVNTSFSISPHVAELKKLKTLFCDYSWVDDKAVNIFLHLTELEDCELNDCRSLTDNIALQAFKSCLKLRDLRLHNCCLITSDFFNNAIQLLKEQHIRKLRTKRVHITVTLSKCICNNFNADDFSDVLEIICMHGYVNYYGDNDDVDNDVFD